MGSDGGSAGTLVKCAADGVATRLQCAECGAPICPKCYVRTAVGLRCQACGTASGPPVVAPGTGSRGPVLAAVAVVVALVVAGGAWAATRGGGGSPADVGDGGTRVTVPATVLGRGELAPGFVWILEARRDGGVCTTLTVSPGPPARERCNPMPGGDRPIERTTTSFLRMPEGTTYLTLGQVSDRTERVRVAPEGVPPWEVTALGGGTGLDVRFFVVHTTSNRPTAFIALAADGSELGRVDNPAMTEPR